MEKFNDDLRKDGYLAECQWNRGVNIFSKRLLMVPIHIEDGAHWCLAVIDIAKKTIAYFDFLKNENFVCMQLLQQYLFQESEAQGFEFQPAVWHSRHQKNITAQMNYFDYAVFVCMYALHLAENIGFNFTQFTFCRYCLKLGYALIFIKVINYCTSSF